MLTATLADATNLGMTRMAEACAVASYRQLAWTVAWHLREETHRRALAICPASGRDCRSPIDVGAEWVTRL
jgi:Tn3 transposase DDE domain